MCISVNMFFFQSIFSTYIYKNIFLDEQMQ